MRRPPTPASDTGVPNDGGGLFLDAGSVFVQTSPVAMNWVYSGPASLYFNQSEVTVAQYEACVNAGTCTSTNTTTNSTNSYCNYGNGRRSDHPINCVNWYGAGEYCTWVGARLPTSDEWFAEASDNGRRTYPWGDSPWRAHLTT
jgi:formylglycine-generating enzyme required for sulfatase activity